MLEACWSESKAHVVNEGDVRASAEGPTKPDRGLLRGNGKSSLNIHLRLRSDPRHTAHHGLQTRANAPPREPEGFPKRGERAEEDVPDNADSTERIPQCGMHRAGGRARRGHGGLMARAAP